MGRIINVVFLIFFYKRHTLETCSKTYDSVRGIIPRSTYLSAPPVIVNVFPDPV